MADEDLKVADGEGEEQPKSKKKLIIILVAVILILALGGAAAWFFLLKEEPVEGEEGEEVVEEEVIEEPPIPAEYIILKPEFVVSYQVGPRQRYLQVNIEVMTRMQTVVDALTLHEPMVRNEIIRVLGEQDFDALRTNDGRIALQKAIHERIGQMLKREAYIEPEAVEAILFTNFVMQ